MLRHHTDGGGDSDHVFALCALLGFKFSPRIPDLKHRRLYSFEKPSTYPTLEPLIAGRIDNRVDFVDLHQFRHCAKRLFGRRSVVIFDQVDPTAEKTVMGVDLIDRDLRAALERFAGPGQWSIKANVDISLLSRCGARRKRETKRERSR